jgi:hypothetical protein
MVYSTGSIIIIVFKEHKNENMDIDYSYYLKENWNVTAGLAPECFSLLLRLSKDNALIITN